jgi:hypothetical protein
VLACTVILNEVKDLESANTFRQPEIIRCDQDD